MCPKRQRKKLCNQRARAPRYSLSTEKPPELLVRSERLADLYRSSATYLCRLGQNPKAKLKRWKGIIDDHGAKLVYKPGKENHVADALSRQNINVLEDEIESDVATIHSEQSLTYTIDTTDNPVICFRNQIIIEEGNSSSVDTFILFKSKVRHIIQIYNRENLLNTLQDVVNAEVVNAIHCSLPILAFIQHRLVELFPSTLFNYTKSFVQDITDTTEQREIVIAEHNRAHRAAQENVKQILWDYFFPKMLRQATETTLNCKTCSLAKYKCHPSKQVVAETPIPSLWGKSFTSTFFQQTEIFFLHALINSLNSPQCRPSHRGP